MGKFEITSRLRAPAADVWAHATDPKGINREFWPVLKMTFPDGRVDLDPARSGQPRRSWLLLLGILPIDYDDVVIVEVDPGHRLLERSSTLTHRIWQHERVVEQVEGGCELTDRLDFTPRTAWLGVVGAPIVRALFRHRHRRLNRLFGR